MSQEQNVIYHLTNIGPLTPIDALKQYGCFRLAAVVHLLKQQGYNIETTMVSNGRKRYASYSIKKAEANAVEKYEEQAGQYIFNGYPKGREMPEVRESSGDSMFSHPPKRQIFG